MRQTWTEEIEAAPEQVWGVLADFANWPGWLAQDGPYPAIVQVVEAGPDTWQATAADGQRGVWQIIDKVEDEHLAWQLQRLERAPLSYQQNNVIEFEPLAEKLTAVQWLVEWQRPETGLKELILDRRINHDIEEMLRISLRNLKIRVESLPEPTSS